jgi:cytochrome P450
MSEAFPRPSRLITTHKELREALRDTQTYSSDLQGDADVRDYRQLPLEVDPPRHHLYRAALAPFFVKSTIEKFIPQFEENSIKLITQYFDSLGKNAVSKLALPLVMQNLGAIFNRPQDVSEWISWGADVWTAESEKRDGGVLHKYLDAIYEEALNNNNEDIWRDIALLEIEGKQISALEFRGIAGVLLAGGRDTIVKLLSGMLWYFGLNPTELEKLRANPENTNSAIQEFLRYLSPLPQMNRTLVPETTAEYLPENRYVGMSFLSGNFDETIFENPFEWNLMRPKNQHLSFGFGPHTCLGIHIADIEAKVFLKTLLNLDFNWTIKSEEIRYHAAPFEKVPDNFERLTIEKY